MSLGKSAASAKVLAALLTTASLVHAQEPTSSTGAGGAKPSAPASTTSKPGVDRKEAMRQFFGLSAPPDPAAVDRGQGLFVANCGFCHGSNANGGNSGPNLVRSVLVLHDEGTGKEIGPVILNGRVSKGMPKFPFKDTQIRDLAAFLLSRSQSTANRMEYKIMNIVTGDPKAGEAYFAQHCASCHSASADLAGIADKFEPVALEARFLYPSTPQGFGAVAPNPKTLPSVSIKTPSGQTISGTLTFMDDFTAVVTGSDGKVQTVELDPNDKSNVTIVDPLKPHEELLKQYSDADVHNILAYLETLK